MSKTKKAVIVIKEDPDGTTSVEVIARPTIGKSGYIGFLALVGFQAIVKCINNEGKSEDEAQQTNL